MSSPHNRRTTAVDSKDPYNDLRVIWARDNKGNKYIVSDQRPKTTPVPPPPTSTTPTSFNRKFKVIGRKQK